MQLRPRWTALEALARRSVDPAVWGWVGGLALLAIVVVSLGTIGLGLPPIPALPLWLLGTGWTVLAALRHAAVQRRRRALDAVLAGLLAQSRSLARQALAQIGPADEERALGMAWRCIAFAHALRDHLRAEPMGEAALTALAPEEGRYTASRSNPPNIVLASMSREIATAYGRARVSAQSMQTLEEGVTALSAVQAEAERLKAAPADAALPVMLHRLAIAFGLLLPFGLAPEAGLWTLPLVAILAYMVFGFEALDATAEAPFAGAADRSALDAVVRSVEIGIRDMLGEPDLPADGAVAESGPSEAGGTAQRV